LTTFVSIGFERVDTGARDPSLASDDTVVGDALVGAADRYCIQVAFG